MNKKRKIRVLLGSILTLALVVTCGVVYQSGSKSTPNEKELVMENEEDSVDQAIKTMNKKRKFRLLLGGILTLALVATCGIVYQSEIGRASCRERV